MGALFSVCLHEGPLRDSAVGICRISALAPSPHAGNGDLPAARTTDKQPALPVCWQGNLQNLVSSGSVARKHSPCHDSLKTNKVTSRFISWYKHLKTSTSKTIPVVTPPPGLTTCWPGQDQNKIWCQGDDVLLGDLPEVPGPQIQSVLL